MGSGIVQTNFLRRLFYKQLARQLRIGDNHRPYETAISDVTEILKEPSQIRQNYAVKGKDHGSIARGYKGEFDDAIGIYSEIKDGDYRKVIITKTQEEVYSLGNHEFLVAGSYIYRGNRRCQDGKMYFELIDPQSTKPVEELVFDQCEQNTRITDKTNVDTKHISVELSNEAEEGMKDNNGLPFLMLQTVTYTLFERCYSSSGMVGYRRSINVVSIFFNVRKDLSLEEFQTIKEDGQELDPWICTQ